MAQARFIDGILKMLLTELDNHYRLEMLGFDFREIVQLNRFEREFEDLGIIGTGGFASVHRVKHKIDGRQYAVKINKIKPSRDKQETEKRFYKMLEEAKTHSLLDHPNVLTYHGCWVEMQRFSSQEEIQINEEEECEAEFQMVLLDDSEDSRDFCFGEESNDDSPIKKKLTKRESLAKRKVKIGDGKSLCDYKQIKLFMMMELCEGNLQQFIQNRGGGQEVWFQNYELIMEMINGLSYLHRKRIIHRDVKIQNFVIEGSKCKIIDFGLAKRVKYWKSSIEQKTEIIHESEEDETFSSSVGTKLFSSPQQATSQNYDYRTDIYSLAIVILMLFCTFTTSHQQRDMLQNIRNRKLNEIVMPEQLKNQLFHCLGTEQERISLAELKNTVKVLMKDHLEKKKQKEMPQLVANQQLESVVNPINFPSKNIKQTPHFFGMKSLGSKKQISRAMEKRETKMHTRWNGRNRALI